MGSIYVIISSFLKGNPISGQKQIFKSAAQAMITKVTQPGLGLGGGSGGWGMGGGDQPAEAHNLKGEPDKCCSCCNKRNKRSNSGSKSLAKAQSFKQPRNRKKCGIIIGVVIMIILLIAIIAVAAGSGGCNCSCHGDDRWADDWEDDRGCRTDAGEFTDCCHPDDE